MQLNHEPPDYAYSLRAADGRSAKVNDQALGSSFFLTRTSWSRNGQW